ncbi:hypothetical protein RHSIM_Rhsim10G0179600 [Rhododendron simsii]|uniref:Retroviral polymerase SH3-like domain-containing protein n=1 Tax=Rhododendron simsii TaxID=118357 RepID=A0A834GC79_RHOSS|nr:hypothetical protein RHSIM_Rhsim10G0179600 [Rhododendron simsii]
MTSFLKGKKLWRIITGDVIKPVKAPEENQSKYEERLEDWDSKNHQVVTWIRNTSVTSISLQFGRFQNQNAPAKAIWDFLKDRYQTTGLSHQYQLLSQLARMRQEPGQSINGFLSQIYAIWDQISLSEPSWTRTIDAALFAAYRDQQRLIQFLMALTTDFEPYKSNIASRPAAAATEDSDSTSFDSVPTPLTPQFSMTDVEAIIQQVLAKSAVYTINRVPTPVIGNLSPYEKLYGTSPNYHHLRVFGCACFVLLQKHQHTKLEPRSRLCYFLGYGIEHKGYQCWDPVSKRLRISRHVIFWEHQMFSSLSKFYLPPISTTPYFTDSSIDIFSDEFDTGTPNDSSSPAPPEASVLLDDHALKLVEPTESPQPSTTSPTETTTCSPDTSCSSEPPPLLSKRY